MNELPPITDSPWFWAIVYTSVPLVALTLLSHKYASRQAHIEWRYQSPTRAAERQLNREAAAADNSAANDDAADPATDLAVPSQQVPETTPQPYSSPENMIISIGPLIALFWLIELLAAVMLTRERRKLRAGLKASNTLVTNA